MERCPIQYFAKYKRLWLTANDWLLSCYPGTTWPYYKSDCDFGTPESAADCPETQASATWSWSEKSRFSSIGTLCPHSWWIAFFFRFSALKRSYYLGMVRRAAEHYQRVPWAARWVQSGVEWASTRAKPISDWKPSWPVFGNKGENNRRTTRLSHYGPQIIYPSIFQSYFMRRFHFWSQFAHISPSDGIKNCLRKAKVKTSFWNVSRDCREIWCFWAQIRNLRTKLRLYVSFYDHWWFLWVTRPRILILVEILLLLFANSTNGSGINRPQIRIRRGRKYPQLTGIKVFFLIRCAPLPSLIF